MSPKEGHVVVRIEKKTLEKLQRIAEKEDRSVSWLIRKAIDLLIKEHNAGKS